MEAHIEQYTARISVLEERVEALTRLTAALGTMAATQAVLKAEAIADKALFHLLILGVRENLTSAMAANDRATAHEHKRVEDKFEAHNGILSATAKATTEDRARFATRDQVDGLADKFLSFKSTTDKALTLAEGAKSGIGLVGSVVLGAFAVMGTVSGVVGLAASTGLFRH